jgi:integrase
MASKLEKLPTTDKGWQAWLGNIKAPEKRQWIPLGRSLEICLETGGAKVFQGRVRRRGDKNARRIPLGVFPATSVAMARTKLEEAKAIAREGRDPSIDRKRERVNLVTLRTVADLVDEYLQRREASGRLRPKSLATEREKLLILRAKLGDRLLADLEARDVSNLVETEAARMRRAGGNGTSANRVLDVTKRMFKMARGWGLVVANPAADVSRPAREQPRERILFDGAVLRSLADPFLNETGQLVFAITGDSFTGDVATSVALMLALTLGLRAGEAAGLQWSSIRFDDEIPTLTVARAKTKAGERTLPLPRQLLDALRTLRASSDKKRAYVFPARSDAKRSQHLHPESLSRALARTCARLGLSEVVLHDLRRSCLSAIAELTGNDSLAERIAGHRGVSVFSRHYDRSARLDPMLEALQRWADAIDDAAARAAPPSLPPPPLALPAPARE